MEINWDLALRDTYAFVISEEAQSIYIFNERGEGSTASVSGIIPLAFATEDQIEAGRQELTFTRPKPDLEFGPHTAEVRKLLDQAHRLTPDQVTKLAEVWGMVGANQCVYARYEAAEIVRVTTRTSPWPTIKDKVSRSAWDVTYAAALALTVQDLISENRFQILYAPWATAMEGQEKEDMDQTESMQKQEVAHSLVKVFDYFRNNYPITFETKEPKRPLHPKEVEAQRNIKIYDFEVKVHGYGQRGTLVIVITPDDKLRTNVEWGPGQERACTDAAGQIVNCLRRELHNIGEEK